jgi:lipoprotein signal peptidase
MQSLFTYLPVILLVGLVAVTVWYILDDPCGKKEGVRKPLVAFVFVGIATFITGLGYSLFYGIKEALSFAIIGLAGLVGIFLLGLLVRKKPSP